MGDFVGARPGPILERRRVRRLPLEKGCAPRAPVRRCAGERGGGGRGWHWPRGPGPSDAVPRVRRLQWAQRPTPPEPPVVPPTRVPVGAPCASPQTPPKNPKTQSARASVARAPPSPVARPRPHTACGPQDGAVPRGGRGGVRDRGHAPDPPKEGVRPSHVRWGRVLPPCDSPSGCCSFTGPWTVTPSALRMLRRVAAFCRPLRPVLLPVSFPRSRSPVVGVPGLCGMWRDVPFACQRRPVVGVLGDVLVVVGVV